MPFLDTNSHLATKPYNFDIMCQGNSENYDRHGFFGTKFRGGHNFLISLGGFYNEREYSGADWLVLLVCLYVSLSVYLSACPCACLSFCQSVCLFVCLSVRAHQHNQPPAGEHAAGGSHAILQCLLLQKRHKQDKIFLCSVESDRTSKPS